jgi:hypothetical protein
MWKRKFDSALLLCVLVALIVGCAGPTVSSPLAAAVPAHDLTGTWNGEFWWLGAFFDLDEGTLLLRIKEDGTFTATMTPTTAPNNLAKPSSWSGTISQRGNLVEFHLSEGKWLTWSSLARSGDTL